MPDITMPPPRTLAPGQRAQLWVADAVTNTSTLVLESDTLLFEAPNWTLDGTRLIVNGAGTLWSVPIASPSLDPIVITGIPDLNNDHVLHPDGEQVFLSANDFQVYLAPLAGGEARRISTSDELTHFLHGVNPDATRLAFVNLEITPDFRLSRANILTMSAQGDDYVWITDTSHPADGSEYSPDGEWLYINTEQFSGHAQLGRVPANGGVPERLRTSHTVDWFPHLSPDGTRAAFIAFPEGTEGHPADLWIDVMFAHTDDWQGGRSFAHVFGGQGTMNVNSWAPDSTRFAYVAYPID